MDMRQLDDRSAPISGIWLPLVTPFREGRLDERSLVRLLRHYLGQPVDGLILAATTGEGLTLDEAESERLTALAAAEVAGKEMEAGARGQALEPRGRAIGARSLAREPNIEPWSASRPASLRARRGRSSR